MLVEGGRVEYWLHKVCDVASSVKAVALEGGRAEYWLYSVRVRDGTGPWVDDVALEGGRVECWL